MKIKLGLAERPVTAVSPKDRNSKT
jgi:hypothetical protein